MKQNSMNSKKHIIDCNKPAKIPKGYDWTIESHKKGGKLVWDASKVELYLSDKQKGKYIEGNELQKELKDKPVLNANVLDYLLEHQELIPEEWKEKTEGYTTFIFFWGTIYRHSSGDLCVRCLYWSGGSWDWNVNWLDDGWSGYYPAALYLSNSKSLDASHGPLEKKVEVPICGDCGQSMFEIGMVCTNHGGKLYQCPEHKNIALK